MTSSRLAGRLAAAAVIALASCTLAIGSAAANPNNADECVRDFFTVAREQYGWSPHDIVVFLNTDNDPNNFQVANVHALREMVANAGIGIIDLNGVYHICPNPT